MFLQVCVCPQGGVSYHALQVVSQHVLQQFSGGWYPSMPCRFPGPHPRGKFGWIWLLGSPGPQGGKLRGIWSRPTPRGEVEGIWSRPTPKGKLRGIWPGGAFSRGRGACSGGMPTPGVWRPLHDGYCCWQYASYWNAFLLTFHDAYSQKIVCPLKVNIVHLNFLNSSQILILTFHAK